MGFPWGEASLCVMYVFHVAKRRSASSMYPHVAKRRSESCTAHFATKNFVECARHEMSNAPRRAKKMRRRDAASIISRSDGRCHPWRRQGTTDLTIARGESPRTATLEKALVPSSLRKPSTRRDGERGSTRLGYGAL